MKAVYYAIYACAVQHIAYDIYLIYAILGGNNYIIIVLIFAAVYLLAYFFAARKLVRDGSFVPDRRSLFPIADDRDPCVDPEYYGRFLCFGI